MSYKFTALDPTVELADDEFDALWDHLAAEVATLTTAQLADELKSINVDLHQISEQSAHVVEPLRPRGPAVDLGALREQIRNEIKRGWT